ncbi:hypothetical protein GALMADRAFT_137783 [Galerina marginata CBS 339.88]|uniref:Uncharacterized protein n=1 Tax=Galerina marginata (strain CBS 339.88) TaxID=685588 RepID=A0A067T8T7_GALM3|nr:hypothetical protein GALMADRAFT_137783 [Galerina marginata CBS 339.88]
MATTTQMFCPSSFDFTFTYYPENTYYTSGVSTPPSLNSLFDVEDIPPSLSVASVALLYPDILPADPLLTSSGAQDSLDNNESDEVSPTSTELDNDNHHGPQSGAPPPPDFLEFPLPIQNATPDELPYPPSALYPPLPEDEGAEQSITDLSVHDDYSTEFTTPPPAKRRRLDSHNQSTQSTHDFTDPVPSSWVLEENGTYWTKPGGYTPAGKVSPGAVVHLHRKSLRMRSQVYSPRPSEAAYHPPSGSQLQSNQGIENEGITSQWKAVQVKKGNQISVVLGRSPTSSTFTDDPS